MRETSPSPHGEFMLSSSLVASRLGRVRNALQHRRAKIVFLGVLVVLGIAVQLWAALQWRSNLDGDEAVFGLIARHMAQGHFTPYVYGQGYLGTLEPALGAVVLVLFGGSAALVTRLVSVALFGVFLVLFGALVQRVWGFRAALLSLLFLALPGRHMLHWTYRPITDFGPMACCGVGALLLAQYHLSGWRSYFRLAAIGALAGLAVWSQPLAAIYFSALGFVWLLGTTEWRAWYEQLSHFCSRVVQISARELLPVVVLGFGGLATLVLFTGACEPAISYRRPRQIALYGLVLVGMATAVLLIRASRRRRMLFGGAASLVVGFALGNAPQWGAWAFAGIAPRPAIYPSCPTDGFARLRLAVREIYPLVWGLPFWTELRTMAFGPLLLWIGAIAIVVAGLAMFLWSNRTTFWSLLALSPLAPERQPVALVGLLLFLPTIIVVLGGNAFDWTSVRYLLIAWQAAAVILALFLVRVGGRWSSLALVLALFWALQVGGNNLVAAQSSWAYIGQPYAAAPLADLRRFLAEHDVRGAYADYWAVYALSLASDEQLLLAPYNGADRYPAYTHAVDSLPTQAFLIKPDLVPPNATTPNDLARVLLDRTKMGGTGPAFARFGPLLHASRLLERRTVANWDVWIVSRQ